MHRLLSFFERTFDDFTILPSVVAADPLRRGLAVVAIARDEARYIREWVVFYKLVGARRIFLYVNERNNEIFDAACDFRRSGFVRLIPWCGFTTADAPQQSAYAHALSNFGPEFRWMAFLDIDEFLFPVEKNTLTDALAAYADLPGVAVPWLMFGPCGHASPPKGLVTEEYTRRAIFPAPWRLRELVQYKSIVDPARIASIKNPHWFYLENGRRAAFDENRRQLHFISERRPQRASANIFRLNHYFAKSDTEVEKKIARSRPDTPTQNARTNKNLERRIRKMIRQIEESPQVEDRLIQRYAPAIKEHLASSTRLAKSA